MYIKMDIEFFTFYLLKTMSDQFLAPQKDPAHLTRTMPDTF